LKKTKRAIEVFRRRIAEKLFEKLDNQFDLRTFQTASAAMQCFVKIGEIISLANNFSRERPSAGINGRFGRLNGKFGVRHRTRFYEARTMSWLLRDAPSVKLTQP
jgi:hypothetical protein